MSIKYYIGFALVLLLFTSLDSHSQQNQSLVFSPQWLPQAQFAGYYIALEKGFYATEGLNVKIEHPPANVPVQEFLYKGHADIISLFLVTALKERINGKSLVNIAQMSEHSAIVFVARKELGINQLSDFENRKVGVWKSGFEEVPKALLNTHNIKVNWIPILSSVNLFLAGGIDLMTVMWYNEYNQIYLCGINEEEMSTFFMKDYGFDIPEDGIYVSKTTLEKRPEDLKRFIRATLKGWDYASRNRKEAVDIVLAQMKNARIPASRAHQKWMLDKILKVQGFSGAGAKNLALSENAFQKTINVLIDDQQVSEQKLIHTDFAKPLIKSFNLTGK